MAEANQSTDRTKEDTSTETPRIIRRGTFVIDTNEQIDTDSFIGSAEVDISDVFEAGVTNPMIDVYQFTDLGAPSYARSLIKCPWTNYSAFDNAVIYNVTMSLDWEQGGVYILDVNTWCRSEVSSRFFYVIYSSSIVKEDVLNPLLSE